MNEMKEVTEVVKPWLMSEESATTPGDGKVPEKPEEEEEDEEDDDEFEDDEEDDDAE